MATMPAKGFRATHCKRGHEFTEENTVWTKDRNGAKARLCRQCVVDRNRRHRGSKLTGPPQPVVSAQERRIQAVTGTKLCSRCKARKPLDRYKRHGKTHDGLYPACKDCCAERWRETDTPERRAREAAKVRDGKYGLAPGDYDQMLEAQGGGCAICSRTCPTGRSLAVDHCHTTGAVRGLLCADCNRSLGMMGDSPERLRSAAAYLEDHADTPVS